MPKHPVAVANEKSLFGSLTPDEFYDRHAVSHSSEFITNSRGLKLFTQWWTPLPSTQVVGVVCVVHAFRSDSNAFIQLTSILFAQSGFATCAIDIQGHGYSDGLDAHIPDINPVVDDVSTFFDSFRARHAPHLPAFIYAESFGGAVALYITLRQRGAWNGLILSGAMCGISDKIKPPWPLEHLLSAVAWFFPTWRVVPTRVSLPDAAYKEEWKKKLAISSPRRLDFRPRAATTLVLLRVCRDLQQRFEQIEVPLLICHGGDDVVCDPASAEDLYKRAASVDKTLKIYPGMWHHLVGEPEENVETAFGDMVEWLRARALQQPSPPA